MGVYAAVSTYQVFESSHLNPSSRAQVTGVGSSVCYGFCKVVPYSLDEKVLSSPLFAGVYSVRILASSSACIVLTTN